MIMSEDLIYLGTEDYDVLEAQNAIPTFWFLLIAPEDLPKIKENIRLCTALMALEFDQRKAFVESLGDAEELGIITLRQDYVLENAQHLQQYVTTVVPTLAPLFEDFLHYLKPLFKEDGYLLIDFDEYIDWYDDLDDFYEVIATIVEDAQKPPTPHAGIEFIDEEDIVASTVGYDELDGDDYPNFAESSDVYFKLLPKHRIPETMHPNGTSFFNKIKRWFI